MSDVETIRDFLREHDAYALPETYGDVTAALDRLEAENARLLKDRDQFRKFWQTELERADRLEAESLRGRGQASELEAENARLSEALREIADSLTHVVRDLTRIARRALGEEAPLPRSFLDDPKIQAQIAGAKERARKGGEKA